MKYFVILSTLIACFAQANVQFKQEEIAFMNQFYLKQGEQLSNQQTQSRLATLSFHLDLAKQKAPTLLNRVSNVGFSTRYHKKRYMLRLLNANISAAVKIKLAITKEELMQLLGDYPADGNADLAFINTLSMPLSGEYTLADAYQDASMQARFNLHQGDINQLTELTNIDVQYQLIKQHYTNKHVRWQVLENLSISQAITPALLSHLGVKASLHNESPYLDKLKTQITPSEIKQYYNQNKQQFRYSAQVTAAIVSFKSHEAAQSKIKNEKALQQILANKKRLIPREALNNSFINQAAFNLSTKQGPTLLRTPINEWVIIQVFDKKYDYYSEKSETVKYQATSALAQAKAKENYATAKKRWQQGTSL